LILSSLSDLGDLDRTTERLADAGLSPVGARVKADLFSRAAANVQQAGASPDSQAIACYVPGRIEFLGKHTDYAGGRSLVAVPERGFCTVAVRRNDNRIEMINAAEGERIEFDIGPGVVPKPGHWSNYPMTVARRLARNFGKELVGASISQASDLPVAAGMSSSSALVVATYFILAACNRLAERPEFNRQIHSREDLAGYVATIENGQSFRELTGDCGVGTFGGSEDHTAMLCAEPGVLKQFAYCPVRLERTVHLPPDHVFAIASSGVVAEKTGDAMAKYNRVSRLASAVMELWNDATGRSDDHLAAAIASSPDAAERIRAVLNARAHPEFAAKHLQDRFQQFLIENEQIIPSVADSLTGEGLRDLGKLVEKSQVEGERLLKNQVPETIFLARSATSNGAVASSAFGAGFGGSVWSLVPAEEARSMLSRWSAAYRKEFPVTAEKAVFFTTLAGPAAFMLTA
jgi:galactokinase